MSERALARTPRRIRVRPATDHTITLNRKQRRGFGRADDAYPQRLARFTAPTKPISGICTYPGQDPELWFPSTGKAGVEQAKEAKALCKVCPALERCREWVLEHEPGEGIFAGLTKTERSRVRSGRPPRQPRVNHGLATGQHHGGT